MELPEHVDSSSHAETTTAVAGGGGAAAAVSGSGYVQQYCDESKCVSRGRSDLFQNSFTCYGDDGAFYPMACSDGFLPVRVMNGDDPSPSIHDGSSLLWEFTCCMKALDESNTTLAAAGAGAGALDIAPTRRCSDPIAMPPDDNEETLAAICQNQTNATLPYPRRMNPYTQSLFYLESGIAMLLGNGMKPKESFLCCDDPIRYEDTTLPLLDDKECVPYHNRYYDSSKIRPNRVGSISVTFCDLDEFIFARPIGESRPASNHSSGTNYQCCKNGPSLPPFVQDQTFRVTVYPILVIYCLAAFVSAILGLGLLIPLLVQRKNEIQKQQHRQQLQQKQHKESLSRTMSSNTSRSFAPREDLSREIFPSDVSFRDSAAQTSGSVRFSGIRGREREPSSRTYSPYNLYLVYLALFDLVHAVLQITLHARYLNQKFNIGFYGLMVSPWSRDSPPVDTPINYAYVLGNLWINAIISSQVLALLESSYRARRIEPPSLSRVNLHGGGVCIGSAMSCVAFYFIPESFLVYILFVGTTMVPPIGYVVYVSILVLRKGYMRSVSGVGRELAFYFFRIVAVFLCFWIPTLALTAYAVVAGETWAAVLVFCMTGFQPIVTFCAILTKTDVRMYILDLFALSYLCEDQKSKAPTKRTTDTNAGSADVIPIHHDPNVNALESGDGVAEGDLDIRKENF